MKQKADLKESLELTDVLTDIEAKSTPNVAKVVRFAILAKELQKLQPVPQILRWSFEGYKIEICESTKQKMQGVPVTHFDVSVTRRNVGGVAQGVVQNAVRDLTKQKLDFEDKIRNLESMKLEEDTAKSGLDYQIKIANENIAKEEDEDRKAEMESNALAFMEEAEKREENSLKILTKLNETKALLDITVKNLKTEEAKTQVPPATEKIAPEHTAYWSVPFC